MFINNIISYICTQKATKLLDLNQNIMKAIITLQELATKLNGKLWSKDGKERIYIDRGYNTKKMSTKTYVEVRNDEFVVRCFIDCPAQNDNWIESQQDEVIENVETEISEIIELTKVELVEAKLSQDETEVEVRISYDGNVEESFLTETQFDERFNKYPQSVFDNLPATKTFVKESISELHAAVKASADLKSRFEREEKAKNFVSQSGLSKKVSHARFGLGEIIEEINDGEKLKILFETEGEKLLLSRFANLTFL